MSTPFVLEIYTESTPNPESQMFVTNMHLLPNYVADFKTKESAGESDLALRLFELPYVNGVFLSNNFVTVTKKADYEWYEITPELREILRVFLTSGKAPVSQALFAKGQPAETTAAQTSGDADPETKIKELLDKYVKPAVEADGGHIAFRSFENGIVNLALQGSCSGCPSSSITLKSGIEGLLKRMVPEVQEVVAVEE